MKPSDAVQKHREAVKSITARFNVCNPRLFGSSSNGTDREGSDVDILVDPKPGVTLFELGGLLEALEALLGVPVDLCTPGDFPSAVRARVLAEARSI